MATTTDTHPQPRTVRNLFGRVALGIVLMAATLVGGMPVANAAGRDGSAAPAPRTEPCLNIVTCGTGTRPPGKVDPGPPRRQADLPTPSVAARLVRPYFMGSGAYAAQVEVTNWKSYHETLFDPDRRYEGCLDNPNTRFRTWVDILDGATGRLHFRYCGMNGPIGLSKLTLFPHKGHPIPRRVAVRLIDNATNRVVVSDPVDLPRFLRVGTGYTTAERANLEFAAEYWDIPVDEVQKAGVMAIRYLHGVSGTTGSKPLRPRPDAERRVYLRVTYTSDWYPDEQHALDWVSNYHDLTLAETQKLGAAVMIYVAAIASR